MKDTARKAFYAMLGAPIVAYKKSVALGNRVTDAARHDFDEAAQEGEGVAKKVTSTSLADEIGARVDLEGIQDRVEKLRDQLEDALSQWRDNFRPGDADRVEKPATKPAPATKAAPAKPAPKTTAKKPAAKTTAKKPAATATKKPAAKTTAKKPAATATKKPAAKTTARKPAAKTTAKKPAATATK